MIDDRLLQFGWNDSYESQFSQYRSSGLVPGRVTARNGYVYTLESAGGKITAQVSGHFQYIALEKSDYPAAGDWVLFRGESEPFIIEKVLDRKGYFSRLAAGNECEEQLIAANIDIMFITAALEGGRNFTERGIERYIVMVREGGAQPVLILNKCDLCAEEERDNFIQRAKSVAGEIPVLMVSALTGEGVDAIRSLLQPGVTAAFTGPSGAGKSALINALLNETAQRTGAIRDDDKRGRHTTTHQELFTLEGGAMVIDTPGLRELRPYAEAESVDLAFAEIADAAKGCRFRDCTHTDEPGCNVLFLLSEGEIDPERYQNYVSLKREIAIFEMRKTEKGRSEQKAKEKQLSKIVREYKKKFSDG